MNTHKLTQATDADAVYVKARIAEADNADNEALTKSERAAAARIEAGQRLIEVRARVSDKAVSETFKGWLEANDIARPTAYRLMTLAGFSEEQHTEAKAKEATRKRESRRAATSIIQKASGKPVGGTQKRKLRAAGIDLDVKLEEGSAEAEEVIAKAAVILNTAPVVARADLSLSMQEKYDRALAAALAKQTKEHEDSFWAKVREEVARRLPDEKAKALQTMKDYNLKLKGVAAQITLEDYRKLLSVLHPDRQPSDSDRAEAFSIVRKLDAYIQVAHR